MKNLILILLIICSFEPTTQTRKRHHSYQTELEEYIDILKKKFVSEFDNRRNHNDNDEQDQDDNSNESNPNTIEVDPNDHINVELWNKLNEQDIAKMPKIHDYSSETDATIWLKWYYRISHRCDQVNALISWNYETNITDENQRILAAQNVLQAPFARITLPIAKKFNEYMKYSKNEDLKRIFGRLAAGAIAKNDTDVKKLSKLHGQLERIYSTTTVCEPNDNKKCYTLSPYLEGLMQTEKDYDRLVWAWKGWHDGCGNKIRPVYLPYIDLLNKTVRENGYNDIAEYWIQDYEMGSPEEFDSTIDQILKDIMPLYEQLHAYVRGRLCTLYPNRFNCNGPIPAHLLGNMWAQQWQDRLDDIIPYPASPLVDIGQILHQKNFTIHRMYTTAEDFFTSIGLDSMTPKFWARSMFEKPTDRAVVCHAAATDLHYHEDYRVRVCTEINDDYFYTVHHEMGHVEYYMAYDHKQPYAYQEGANSGFHEAIGDTIGMYAISPEHLIKLGFLDRDDVDAEYGINFLLRMALQKVAFIPFSYVMDKYRFLLFRNKIDREHELNSMWWALRIEHGGIMAAVHRTDKVNFDPGAKYHIPANVPYARYFIAHILQFQFYRAMCRIQGHTKELYMCDIYGNKIVGEKFKKMLEMGNSKPWQEILESLTGETRLEPEAMLEYFEPLYKWLKEENYAKGYKVGWM